MEDISACLRCNWFVSLSSCESVSVGGALVRGSSALPTR
jgi:hypothetical protein